jgi:RimJ/RimL family protein N-acetyltransferase
VAAVEQVGPAGQAERVGNDVQLILERCIVRSWRPSDVESLARHADNRKIWINLRDAFPHPYTNRDARDFIRTALQRTPETTFAIAVNEEAVGSIGYVLHPDVERVSAEIGYWIAEPFWGRGIATEALVAVTGQAIDAHGLTRVYALPFAWNVASCRVLEKAGYVLEARLRDSAIKNGQLTDQMQYAFIAADRPRS